MGSDDWDPRFMDSCPPWVRSNLVLCLQRKTAADALPSIFAVVTTNGKITAVGLVGGYLLFLLLWLPFWLLTFILSEWGVYILSFTTIFYVGRCIIRLLAFPGASQKVTKEIEAEFAKYSVRVLEASVGSLVEVTTFLSNPVDGSSRGGIANYEIKPLWRRAKTHLNRVLSVYLEVLLYLYQQPSESNSLNNNSSPFTKHGNNKLVGDIGNLSGLTPQAQAEGRALMNLLRIVVAQADELEQHAGAVLEGTSRPSGHPSSALSDVAKQKVHQLLQSSQELWDFVTSLKPTSSDNDSNNISMNAADSDEDLTMEAVRRRFEEQGGSAMETLQSGFASILPMLDPPPHTSIFGFDVQRGCMLSRYTGARQFWVRRPKGGMLDVLHFPSTNHSPNSPRNEKAVLYCNPNAGLIEVSTGMSLQGGNVPSADPDNAHDDSWIDYYTALGYDVYVYNYAGYGRSYGTTLCVSGRNAGEYYTPGVLPRIGRIIRSCFLTFTPTPDTLRADGIAVGQYLLHDLNIQQLILHGESIGGIAASSTARYLSHLPTTSNKVCLLLCDRTFCNLEAVAQRLIGGWSGYAIRLLAPLWSTDVAGDFLAASCPKVVANDAADAIISDAASLKSGIALWKEIHRGNTTTKGIGWMSDTPLQYRMADWENVCVNDSKYLAGKNLFRVKSPVWPNDRNISIEEAFHFAACCQRIGKKAKNAIKNLRNGTEMSVEMDHRAGVLPSSPLVMEVWKMLACCDGLTGSPLGVAVRNGFDATVAWLCSCVVFGAQSIVEVAESRGGNDGRKSTIEVFPADFDSRPPDYEAKEAEGLVHPKPIPEVLERVVFYLEAGDETLIELSHELQYVVGMLQYIQNRLSAPQSIEAAKRNLHLHPTESTLGSFLNLHCGHNNSFSRSERKKLQHLLEAVCDREGLCI